MAHDDAVRCRELIDTNRMPEALVVARRLARAQPGNLAAQALLLEVLFAKGEHASIATELTALERTHPGSVELQKLKKRFSRRA